MNEADQIDGLCLGGIPFHFVPPPNTRQIVILRLPLAFSHTGLIALLTRCPAISRGKVHVHV